MSFESSSRCLLPNVSVIPALQSPPLCIVILTRKAAISRENGYFCLVLTRRYSVVEPKVI
jgi:hypothetical protein